MFTLPSMAAAVDAAARTQKESAHNLANIDTPGFVSKHTDFKAMLMDDKNGLKHGAAFEAYMEDIGAREPGVNPEAEVARLGEAGMEHAACVQLINTRYAQMRLAIREGK